MVYNLPWSYLQTYFVSSAKLISHGDNKHAYLGSVITSSLESPLENEDVLLESFKSMRSVVLKGLGIKKVENHSFR